MHGSGSVAPADRPGRAGGHRRIARRAGPPTPETDSAVDGPPGDAWQEQATRDLAEHLGPLARIAVRRTAPTVDSPRDLYRALAAHIPDERRRADFLKKAPPA